MDYIQHYESPLGGITLASDGEALVGLWFVGQKYYGSVLCGEGREEDLSVFRQAKRWLDIYFSGKAPDFMPPLVMRGTPFRKEVWEIMRSIPFGQTMSYGEIAEKLSEQRKNGGKTSARAVGNAVGHNPISLMIPCHRVIGTKGNLTGYAGGIEKKEKLLAMERVDM